VFWADCLKSLKRKRVLALLLVVDSRGSSPGKAGAKLFIDADGISYGTIGGGKVEYDLSAQALSLLHEPESCTRLFYQQHNGFGQVCGGTQTVLFYRLAQADLCILEQVNQAFQEQVVRQLSFTPQGLMIGTPEETSPELFFSDSLEAGWIYQELIGIQKTAYIIGGGHVSLALSQVLALLDFEIIVIDQRSEVKTMDDNHFAQRKIIAPYTEVDRIVPDGKQVYIFIMTHSHVIDQQVLAKLANKQWTYLGLLGSQRKIKLLQDNLSESIDPERWKLIHAPLGLSINSSTPMEIAISIAAELIQLE
jgi:xanthine dehydrogenase accessory factor